MLFDNNFKLSSVLRSIGRKMQKSNANICNFLTVNKTVISIFIYFKSLINGQKRQDYLYFIDMKNEAKWEIEMGLKIQVFQLWFNAIILISSARKIKKGRSTAVVECTVFRQSFYAQCLRWRSCLTNGNQSIN